MAEHTIQLRLGDCIEVLGALPEGSVGAVICDPPYGLSFMNKEWDKLELTGSASRPDTSETATSRSTRGQGHGIHAGKPAFDLTAQAQQAMQEWHLAWLAECFRVLVPGGIIKAFSATRTNHRLCAAMEGAGFVLPPEHSLEAWAYGCLTDDAEILTKHGWKLGVDVVEGEQVACWDSITGDIRLDAIQEVICKPYGGEMVVFRNDNTDQMLTPNHRVYHKPLDGEVQVGSAKSLVGRWVRLPIKNRWGMGYTMALGTAEFYEGDVWCVRVPSGAFVARRNGMVFITGNSGCPKYKNTSKAIDAHLGKLEERGVVGEKSGTYPTQHGTWSMATSLANTTKGERHVERITEAATPEAARFEGWATALKPGWEPFIVGVKPRSVSGLCSPGGRGQTQEQVMPEIDINLNGFREEPDSPKHWGFEERLRSKMVRISVGDVDLRPLTSPRHDQRNTSSCVAQAAVKALEIKRIQAKGRAAHIDLSRLAVYWMARNLMFPKETDKDGGTYVSLAFDAMRRFGVPPEADHPWDIAALFEAPSWSAMRKAYVSKIESFYKIRSTGQRRVDMVIEALQAGNPVVFGTNVDSSWSRYEKGEVLKPVSNADRNGRHATVLIGIENGVFIGENSWGTQWGDDGFYLMAPAVIASSVSMDLWVPQAGFETYQEQQA